jgi:hypothetical protein
VLQELPFGVPAEPAEPEEDEPPVPCEPEDDPPVPVCVSQTEAQDSIPVQVAPSMHAMHAALAAPHAVSQLVDVESPQPASLLHTEAQSPPVEALVPSPGVTCPG